MFSPFFFFFPKAVGKETDTGFYVMLKKELLQLSLEKGGYVQARVTIFQKPHSIFTFKVIAE